MAEMLPLGKKDARYVPSDKFFTEFRYSTAPVTVPKVFGHGNTFNAWGMNGNDQYGDCVLAEGAHTTELINNLGLGDNVVGAEPVAVTTQNSIDDYFAVNQVPPGPPNSSSDQGTDMHAALDYRVQTGLIDSTGARHKIAAYVTLEPGNLQHLLEAMWIFDCVTIGFQFPTSAMGQFDAGQVWSVVPSSIEGGHCVPLVGVPALGNLACVTWGRRQVMTTGFFTKYCDEAYAFITKESLEAKTQKTWNGFAWADLQARLQMV